MKHVLTVGFAIAAIVIGWALGAHVTAQLTANTSNNNAPANPAPTGMM